MSDLEKAISTARHYEVLLKEKYLARGMGLTSATKSVSRNLPDQIRQRLQYIGSVRNEFAHTRIDKIPDPARFDEASKELEDFFKAVPTSAMRDNPQWTELIETRVWPLRLFSSDQSRLYVRVAGDVKIFPPGAHWILPLGVIEVGHVSMLPLALPLFSLLPLISKDKFDVDLSVEITAAVADSVPAIKSIVLAPDQQVDGIRSQLLVEMQRICADRNYDELALSLHDLAELLKQRANDRLSAGGTSALLITECVIAECELADERIEAMRRQLQHSAEEMRVRSEEQKLALEAQRHDIEIQKLRFEAETEKRRIEAKFLREKAALEREIGLQDLDLVRAKAELAADPGGRYVLFPDNSHEIERRTLLRDAELLRATLSERKVLQMLELAVQAGFTQAEVQTLRTNFSQIFGVHAIQQPLGLTDGSGVVSNLAADQATQGELSG